MPLQLWIERQFSLSDLSNRPHSLPREGILEIEFRQKKNLEWRFFVLVNFLMSEKIATVNQGCQIFLATTYLNGKVYQMAICEVYPKAIKYSYIFHSIALQNRSTLWFLVWKYTTWQPCSKSVMNKRKVWMPFLGGASFGLNTYLPPQKMSMLATADISICHSQ
jgi:hypothetical protein